MGLNDRDYMRGRTGVPSPRGGYKFIRNIAIPFALACAVLAAAYWVFDRSLAHRSNQTSSNQSSPAPIQPPSITPQPARQTATKPPLQDTHGIYKRMVEGKTIYSDQACQKNAKNKALELHDSAGIVSPPNWIRGKRTEARNRQFEIHC